MVGVALLVRPQLLSRPIIRKRKERLESLRTGAEEKYLDEQRALETYQWVGGVTAWRTFGFLLVLVGLFSLLPPAVPDVGP